MKKIIVSLTVFSMLMAAPCAFADWNGHPGVHGNHAYFRYHDHPHYGVYTNNFYPGEYYPVWVGGSRYYYDDGIYYNYLGGQYVVAQPPIGAVVTTIPSDFQQVVINGVTYYTDNGVYYAYTSNGYKVVNPPVASVPSAQGTFVVNVPTHNGTFVAVTLRKSGNGFVGPQGEFYAAFPQVSQLRMMYGK